MQMSLVYSRDGAAASLLLLERLIDEIVKGKFRPDSTRSGRIVESPDELPGPQLCKVKVEVVESSDDEAAIDADVAQSSDSTSDSSSSDQGIPQDHSLNKVYTVFGGGFTLGQASLLRRLHFESTTLMIASVKQRVDGEASDRPDSVKRIPVAEKRYRLEQQEQRLAGIAISGELEPSHQLLDLTNNVLETGSIVWIAPSRCTKRSEEVQLSIKERPSSVQVENQQLKIAQISEDFKADCGSEIKLQWCLQRRGIAMDQCQLLTWATHEAWVQQLFRTLSQQAPPNFHPVRMDQLVRADRELWTLLAQEHKGTLKVNAAGEIPLEGLFKRFCQDPRITMFLLPAPAGAKTTDKENITKRPTVVNGSQYHLVQLGSNNQLERNGVEKETTMFNTLVQLPHKFHMLLRFMSKIQDQTQVDELCKFLEEEADNVAAYPFVLCERIIDCIKHKVLSYGAIQSNNLEQQLQQPDADAAGRIALGSLPRGAKVKPLVAEFGSFTAAVAPVQQSLCVEEFLKQQPKGSKITSRQLLTRGEIRVEGEGVSHHFLANSKELPDDAMVEMCWIGVPSDPDDFVQRALRAGHPRGLDVHVDAAMASVVKANLVDPPFCLAKKRVEFMKKWTARAQDLKLEEEKFREKMPEHVRNVLGNKNVEALRKRQDAELEEQTWQETEEELRKGWIFIDDSEDAEKLRGRMIFFEGFTFGRVANSSTKSLGRFCGSSNKPKPLDAEMTRALEFLQQRISEGRPLKIERNLHSTWLVFTDGACNQEELKGSVGGVLYDPSGACVGYFGVLAKGATLTNIDWEKEPHPEPWISEGAALGRLCNSPEPVSKFSASMRTTLEFLQQRDQSVESYMTPMETAYNFLGSEFNVPDRVMDDLLERSQNPIHELEVLPVVYYIDNESPRMAYIRGDGETQRAAQMIHAFVQQESAMQHRVWFGRVPSYSNPADGPSRLDFKEVLELGATKTNINWELVMKHLEL
ncbi:unnamed protein product [Cladocopium goreaui]|uniref:Uncharacterized protein n=1 Tax=Cladocopium goreaui TaxID=2562237 RepID=A0A9P1FVE8_9DINO|nr:unnamed protein product [Cladocopium goreaui]